MLLCLQCSVSTFGLSAHQVFAHVDTQARCPSNKLIITKVRVTGGLSALWYLSHLCFLCTDARCWLADLTFFFNCSFTIADFLFDLQVTAADLGHSVGVGVLNSLVFVVQRLVWAITNTLTKKDFYCIVLRLTVRFSLFLIPSSTFLAMCVITFWFQGMLKKCFRDIYL